MPPTEVAEKIETAPKIEGRETNPSDEVLELIQENSEDTKVSTAPANESSGLWTAQPEVPAVTPVIERPVEPVVIAPKPVETPISMDSSFAGIPGQTRVETAQTQSDLSKYADNELKTVGETATDDSFDLKINMPKAETMVEEYEQNPGRGIHHQMDPAYKAELTGDIEKGIEKADEKLEDLLARLRQERDGLRERAMREKETKAAELSRIMTERETAQKEITERHAAEQKELEDRYSQQVETLTNELASIEQVLSEI